MTFGSLHAVDKAYDERDNIEQKKVTKELTKIKRNTHEQTQKILDFMKADKIEDVKKKANFDQVSYENGKKKVLSSFF